MLKTKEKMFVFKKNIYICVKNKGGNIAKISKLIIEVITTDTKQRGIWPKEKLINSGKQAIGDDISINSSNVKININNV